MVWSESMNKIAIFSILIFLSGKTQSSISEKSTFQDRAFYCSTKANAKEASVLNARHHASIRLRDQDQIFGGGHICSGVVIGSSVVLTTAQCVHNYKENKPYHPSELKVVLGSTTRFEQQEQNLIFGVTHSYQHEQFVASSLFADVAILMLERDIPKANEHVKPIALPRADVGKTILFDTQNTRQLKVTSWLQANKGSHHNQLMLLNVSTASDETCLKYYGKSVFGPGMLCTESNEAFSTDFGSPLFVGDILVGLRSFALGHKSPAIYTDVLHHKGWILSVVGDGSNQNSSIWGALGLLLLTFVALRRSSFHSKVHFYNSSCK